MKCPKCGSGGIINTNVDLIYMVIDVECLDCNYEFRLRIDDEIIEIEEDEN